MRRLLARILLSAGILVPAAAFAFYQTPSALLRVLEPGGSPRSMNAELHLRVPSETVFVSAWMKGAAEGRTPAAMKGKFAVTVDVADPSERLWARVRMEMLLHQGMVYARLNGFEGSKGGVQMRIEPQPWVVWQLPEESLQAKSTEETMVELFRSMDIQTDTAEVRAFLDAVTDALFRMDYTQYQGGFAFSLKPAPGFLEATLRAASQTALGQKLDITMEDTDPAEIAEAQDILDRALNMHMKVNTNTIGEFLFLKHYTSFMYEGVEAVVQGAMQHQQHPVYLDTPENALTPEEFGEHLERSGLTDTLDEAFGGLMVFGMGMQDWGGEEWEDEEWEDDTWEDAWEEDLWEEEEDRPVRVRRPLPRRGATDVDPGVQRVRLTDAPACSGDRSSVEYLFAVRKGLCAAPSRGSFRVNDLSNAKQLNPRTTRYKNPTLAPQTP